MENPPQSGRFRGAEAPLAALAGRLPVGTFRATSGADRPTTTAPARAVAPLVFVCVPVRFGPGGLGIFTESQLRGAGSGRPGILTTGFLGGGLTTAFLAAAVFVLLGSEGLAGEAPWATLCRSASFWLNTHFRFCASQTGSGRGGLAGPVCGPPAPPHAAVPSVAPARG